MSYRIRKYSIAWWAKNTGIFLLTGAMFLAVGLSEAPTVPEEPEAEPEVVRTIEYIPAEPPGEEIPLTVPEKIEMLCIEYDVDAEIALAIARLETGHFTSKAFTEYNNVGGMSYNEVPIQYDSIEEGIEAFVKNLAGYKAKGLDTVEEIGAKWCPVNYNHWVSLVNQIMKENYDD